MLSKRTDAFWGGVSDGGDEGALVIRHLWILAFASTAAVSLYLAASKWRVGIGFPLDDAWIHQTYARNFAAWGNWAFWEGQKSGGSTSPLWTALLALGYWLRMPYFVWTFFWGGVFLFGIAVEGERFLRKTVAEYRSSFPWAGIFLIGEWHLLWAAVSGMETLLYAFFVVLVLTRLARGERNYFLFGVLTGISVWVRPGGVTLLGPVLVTILFSGKSFRKIFDDLFKLFFSFGILLAFYLVFNLYVTGTPYPSTFYAKQEEYALLREVFPFGTRFLAELKLTLVGAGVLLLPAVLFFGWLAYRRRDLATLAGGVWFLGYAAMYALMLPVTYQHGRYMIPAMPIYFLWGLGGAFRLFEILKHKHWGSAGILAWRISLLFVWLIFFGLGAKSYADDVAFIENEMVTTAKWVSENLPPDALIAAHDIGALGYFYGGELVDLAGLVSPDVISFLRDEGKLTVYLNKRQVNYLIVFPSWYNTLSEGLPLVYNTENRSLFPNSENMAVYEWVQQ